VACVRNLRARAGTRQIARAKNFGEALEEYEFHEDVKCADASSAPCGKQTVGLSQRRHVTIERPARFIGKESKKPEEIEEGSVPDAGDVYTESPDPRRDKWVMRILPVLRGASVSAIINATVMSPRAVKRVRAGRFCRISREVKTLKSYRSARPRIV
jgi:hypothetical protein